MRIGVLTISDRVSAGDRADEGGPLVAQIASKIGEVTATAVVPDDRALIEAAICGWADAGTVDLILTTGGTGLGPRDVTPEATRAVLDREAPGIAEAMRAAGLHQTPFAALSRQVAGQRARALVVNLPGSPKAIREGLEAILDALPHAVEMIAGGEPPAEQERHP